MAKRVRVPSLVAAIALLTAAGLAVVPAGAMAISSRRQLDARKEDEVAETCQQGPDLARFPESSEQFRGQVAKGLKASMPHSKAAISGH